MRVGIIANPMGARATGMGKVLFEMLQHMRRQNIELYCLRHANTELVYPLSFDGEIKFDPPTPSLLPVKLFYHTVQFPRAISEHSLDLVHCPFQNVPFYFWFLQCPSVVTIHGTAAFELPPKLHSQPSRKHRFSYRLFRRQVDRVISISESAKQNIINYYPFHENDIEVIYHGVSDRYRPTDGQDRIQTELQEKYGIPSPFVLNVSRTQLKKNVETLVEAFARAIEAGYDHSLVLVGGESSAHGQVINAIADAGIEDRVYFSPYIREDDMPKLYAAADIFCFPTLHEGFGLPIIEAMACGTPVVTSNVYACKEVADDAAVLVNPSNTDAIARSICNLLDDDEHYRNLRERGLKRATRFSWDDSAKRHREVYCDVISNS